MEKFETILSTISNMSVIELSELVKAIEEKFGVSATPVAVAGAGAAVAEVAKSEEKSEYKVTLQDSGPEKIKVIKALRSVRSDLGLAEAKKAIDEAPTVLAESAPKEDAKKLKEVLEAAGAKVELS